MSDVTFHLVCGSTGAGKTTHALGLVRETGAMHFSIDDWMRCGRQIVGTALELGKRGVSSVLDLGFQREDQRRAVAEAARTAGLGVRLHFLDVPADERWRRVSGRNDRQGETYRVTVTRPMFDFIETIWQPPGPAEMAAMEGVRVG
jgi:predicted kinase